MTTYYNINYNECVMRGKEITKVFSIAFLFAVLVILASVVCFADTPPAYNDEVPLDIYVNGTRISDVAYTIKGNIYLNLDTIRQYGDTTGITFELTGFPSEAAEDINFTTINVGVVYETTLVRYNPDGTTYADWTIKLNSVTEGGY